MSEISSDVLAQMRRIHSAVNDGTLDKGTVNDALRVMHDLLSSATVGEQEPAPMGSHEPDVEEHGAGGEAPPVHKKARKKR